MPGIFSRSIDVVRSMLSQATAGVREERVIRYMLNEMQRGKSYEQVVNEAYVVNHTTAQARERMVENPRILSGIEDQLAGQHYNYTVDYAPLRSTDAAD